MLLAIALALLVAQGLSAALIWREQNARRVQLTVNEAAFRLIGSRHAMAGAMGVRTGRPPPDDAWRLPRGARAVDSRSPEQPGDRRADAETALEEVLDAQGVVHRRCWWSSVPARDPVVWPWLLHVGAARKLWRPSARRAPDHRLDPAP
jgi:hypothetical protein